MIESETFEEWWTHDPDEDPRAEALAKMVAGEAFLAGQRSREGEVQGLRSEVERLREGLGEACDAFDSWESASVINSHWGPEDILEKYRALLAKPDEEPDPNSASERAFAIGRALGMDLPRSKPTTCAPPVGWVPLSPASEYRCEFKGCYEAAEYRTKPRPNLTPRGRIMACREHADGKPPVCGGPEKGAP